MTTTNDELDQIAKQRDTENVKAEIELIGKSLESLEKNKAILEEKRAVHGRMFELQLENLEVVNPHFKYETLPEYQELHKRHTEIAWDMKDRFEYQKYIDQVDSSIETHKEQIESLKKKLEESEE